MSTQEVPKQIQLNGSLPLNKKLYLAASSTSFGATKAIPILPAVIPKHAIARVGPRSTITAVGDQPKGYGKFVEWHEADSALALIVFINPADHLGVMITGVKQTDTIEIVSATGIASFSETTANKGISSLIGVIAAGAEAVASAFGSSEAAPVIEAGAKYAKEMFKEEKVKTKRRDPFGEDPGSGHKAKQEGGVIISLPSAGRIYYSGDDDHRERWIKEPGIRDASHYPAHVTGAFFLRGRDKRIADADGDIFISAWDHIFEDNVGTYRLHVLLKRGDGNVPIEG